LDYKLIAVDLDDSLLGNDLKISEANRRALYAAREKGVQVTIATGRMLDSALPFVKELNINIPVITYQGAFIKDTITGSTLEKMAVPMEYAARAIEECKKEKLHIQIYSEESYYYERENKYSQLYRSISGIQGTEVHNLLEFMKEDPIKVVIIDEPERIAVYRQHFDNMFGNVLQVSISKPYFLELTNINATKGNALAKLGSMLGISREEMIAIGDSYNDISMIEYAGLGVAMGNASDHVKTYAQYVTKGNCEDGVADVVDKFILRKE